MSRIGRVIQTTLPTDLLTVHFWAYWENCDSPTDVISIYASENFNETTEVDNLVTTVSGSSFCGDDKWHRYSIDMSAFSGLVMPGIKFTLAENEVNGGFTKVFIDNIVLERCPPDCKASYPALAGFPSPGIDEEVAANMYDYETNGAIGSIQTIKSGTTVDYDSGTDITMYQGFTVELGAVFCAFIDGCNGEGGAVDPLGEEETTPTLLKEEASLGQK